jgi:diadenylate cyclase
MRIVGWILQVLILAAAIHLFLRFVRTTRGSRLIRGLLVSVLVGFVGLWGLSKALDLEELEHVLQGATGFVAVIIAIVFQPELRRGIAQLGERSFTGPLIKRSAPDTVREIVRAVTSMSARRQGALIAFERETSLHPYVEEGANIDGAVNSRLIESLFHPGSELHDGAAIVRKDRIVAAGCFFPLPEVGEIAASTGTRHRAAMGITEESDAVVVVVSEETGSISIAREGRIRFDVPPDRLEEELRKLLYAEGETRRRKARVLRSFGATVRRDAPWFATSALLACGILYVAHQDIKITREFPVRVVGLSPAVRRAPSDGEVVVVLASEDERLLSPTRERQLKIAVSGTRAQLDELGGSLSGVVELPDGWRDQPLEADMIEWDEHEAGLSYDWLDDRAPTLEVGRYGSRRIVLQPAHVVIDDARLDPRYEVRREDVHFEPTSTVDLSGPVDLLPIVGAGIPLELQTVQISPDDRTDRRERAVLAPGMRERGFAIEGETDVTIVVPILPARREAGFVTQEVELLVAPDRIGELARWSLPANAQTARFSIQTSGLVPVDLDPDSPALLERLSTIKRFVDENLRVYVDLGELPADGEGRALPLRWTWRRDWRQSLDSLGLDRGTLGERAELGVRLEGEPEVLLEPGPAAGSSPAGIEPKNGGAAGSAEKEN